MHEINDVVKRPSAIGVMVGALLLALSLTPSLIPRTWVQQAVISALTFICGYGVGVAVHAVWRYLELPSTPQKQQRRVTLIALSIVGLVLIYFMFQALGWQNNVRQTVGLEPVDSAHSIRAVLLAAVISAILILLFRLLWWIAAATMRFVTRYIPHRYGKVIGGIVGIVLAVTLLNSVLLDTIVDSMNASYALADSGTDENVHPPTSALRSGSPESLAAWETLGKQGRRFVGTGPTQEDIAAIWDDEEVSEPIRIYIGDQSADTLAERAELALAELIRTGAFERDKLLLVTSTGNGWVDSNAIDTFEYMHGGDTAVLAFQYSYLPSAIAIVADKDAATDASLVMFNTIHHYWQALDEEKRAEFYLHGLSLGAYGSQAAVSSVSQFNDPVQGGLWAGPPFVSHFWRQITDAREAGTPVWHPIYQDGNTIRFTNTGEGLDEAEETWQDNRFIYLQQSGDPIVFFTVDSLFREPEWLKEESRSPKAPSEMRWYPLVTFWQLVFDMVLGTSDTLPDGNGHRYGSGSYIDAWMALTEPEGWDEARVEEFKEWFLTLGNPNKP